MSGIHLPRPLLWLLCLRSPWSSRLNHAHLELIISPPRFYISSSLSLPPLFVIECVRCYVLLYGFPVTCSTLCCLFHSDSTIRYRLRFSSTHISDQLHFSPSATIQLEQPFKYGGNVYSQLYLNVDGYLAFFVPNINDEVPNSELGKDIIAPLWTDLDFSVGEKTYKQATSGPLIDQANQEMNRMFPGVNFLASWVFVATWKNVPIEFSYSESNNTHIIFKNNVGTIDGIGVISRSGGLNITMSCVYPLIRSISMPTDIQALGSVLSKDLSTEGSYQISIIPYTDATFLVPISGNVTLEVNHQMYIGVEVDRFDSTQIALVLDSCWATPDNQTDSSIRWDLIINECPNPNDGTVAVLQNAVSTSSNFSFRMFTFTGFSNKIFLHCQVHLCLQESGNCARNCNGARSRKRRNVHFYDSAAISMEF